MPETFTISELAKEFDITTRTIRHYEDQRLLIPQRDGQHRIYSNKDRVRLRLILRGKRVGFSLGEIKEIIDMYDSPQGEAKQTQLLLTKIQQRRAQLQQQKKDIEDILHELERIEKSVSD
ncbi:MAG: MerR family DNA-binding transcriptional regulator [Pseudomonadota bacterium]